MTVLIAVLPVFPVPNHLFVADSKDLLTPFLFETCKLKAHFTITLKLVTYLIILLEMYLQLQLTEIFVFLHKATVFLEHSLAEIY